MSDENKDLGDKAEDAFDKAKETAKDLGHKAEDAFDNAKDKSEKAYDKAKESAKEFSEDAKESAKDFSENAKKTANEFTAGAKEAFSGAGGENKKILAGILAIILGSLGIHKFILGYQKEGIIMLAITLVVGFFTCGIGASAMGLVGVIEGIIYLTKSDEEFYNTYQVGRKPWF
jgi:TM2 domain-containing membrane protein YozV